MKLTEKCLIAFEAWYNDIHFNSQQCKQGYKGFMLQHPSMKYGVYVDFFDSVEIIVNSGQNLSNVIGKKFYCYVRKVDSSDFALQEHESNRQNARNKAIEKADELFNEKNK